MADVPGRVLELWREYQTALAEHGITNHVMRLELEIWQATRLAPGVDTLPEEEIHRLAFDNKPQPARLMRWNV